MAKANSSQHSLKRKIVLPWPDAVYVIDPHLFHIDDSKPGCDHTNWPYSLPLGVQAELREKQPAPYHFNLMLEIWTGIFAKINHVAVSNKKHNTNQYTRIDMYNATWAALGYIENQCPKALRLLALVEINHKKQLYVY
jgi:hypothetical protein